MILTQSGHVVKHLQYSCCNRSLGTRLFNYTLMHTYYAISNCILQNRILFHQVAANCSVLFRFRIVGVLGIDLEGQGCDNLCPAASGDLPTLYGMHCLSRKLMTASIIHMCIMLAVTNDNWNVNFKTKF